MSLTSYRAAPPRAKNKPSRKLAQKANTISQRKEINKVGVSLPEHFMWLEDQAATYSPVP